MGPARSVDDEYEGWERPSGIFVLAPIGGPASVRVRELQVMYDAKLAAAYAPHVTLAGSSGVGPIRPDTPPDVIRRHLAPVVESMLPLELRFGRPHRFMQTDIISLPLDVHGPLRALHDQIARSGLPFGNARYTFTPHVTLNLYRTLTADAERALLAVRVTEPVVLDHLVLSATSTLGPPTTVLVLRLGESIG